MTNSTTVPRPAPSLARNIAFLNLLVASRPALADIPVDIEVLKDGSVRLNCEYRSKDTPEIAARVAKALGADLDQRPGTTREGESFVVHSVSGTFYGVRISFDGYTFEEDEQPAVEPDAATLPHVEATAEGTRVTA